MTLLNRLASVANRFLHRAKDEQDLEDDLQGFVDLAAAQKVRDGVPPAEARRLAILELGGVEQIKERVRTDRHGAWLEEIAQDVRHAFRTAAKNPGFTAIIVLTLALGIGANTAIFSLVDALMLRWLPVRDPQDLVQVTLQTPGVRNPGESFSYPIVRALAGQQEIFAALAGFSGFSFNVGSPGSIVKVPGALVTGAFYETLGVNPARGRLLTTNDDEPGAPPVAVISDGYWERQFVRSSEAVGQSILLNSVPVTIIGVSPPGFVGANVGQIADITVSVATLPRVSPEAAPLLGPGNFWLRVLARPVEGISIPEAEAHLSASWPRISEELIAPQWPLARRQSIAGGRFQLSPGGTGWTFLRQIYRKPLAVLMSMVAVVLLIACANIASLLLARASARYREVAVRLAIGASRGRIVRQFLVESTLLSLVGAAFGIGLAWLSGRFLVNLISSGPLQVVFDLTPNRNILAFTTGVAMATAVLFGAAPAILTTAAGPSGVLKEDARMSSSRWRVLPWLVSAQVALSLVLLVGAGLLVRTLQNLRSSDPGFNTAGVLLVDLEGRRTGLFQDIRDDVQRVPGVVSASLSTHTPLSGSIWSEPAVPAGQSIPETDNAYFVGAGPGFFATMQIRLLSGREFIDRDSFGAVDVAVVNEEFARRHFPGQNAVGQHLSAKVRSSRKNLEIVGLAKNTNAAGLRAAPPPTVYVSYAQLTGDFPTTLEVRAAGNLADVASNVRRVLQARLPSSAIEVRALSAQVDSAIGQERLLATLAGGFGLLALTLACIGLYGLLAYRVAQRTKEIGVRMALGAQRKRVIALVLKGAARLILIGIVVGLPVAWAASHWLESMLFGLKRSDPSAIGGAIGLLVTAALVATYLPALRASRVDPMAALRHE
jgi:putative ABC transport system permease protein